MSQKGELISTIAAVVVAFIGAGVLVKYLSKSECEPVEDGGSNENEETPVVDTIVKMGQVNDNDITAGAFGKLNEIVIKFDKAVFKNSKYMVNMQMANFDTEIHDAGLRTSRKTSEGFSILKEGNTSFTSKDKFPVDLSSFSDPVICFLTADNGQGYFTFEGRSTGSELKIYKYNKGKIEELWTSEQEMMYITLLKCGRSVGAIYASDSSISIIFDITLSPIRVHKVACRKMLDIKLGDQLGYRPMIDGNGKLHSFDSDYVFIGFKGQFKLVETQTASQLNVTAANRSTDVHESENMDFYASGSSITFLVVLTENVVSLYKTNFDFLKQYDNSELILDDDNNNQEIEIETITVSYKEDFMPSACRLSPWGTPFVLWFKLTEANMMQLHLVEGEGSDKTWYEREIEIPENTTTDDLTNCTFSLSINQIGKRKTVCINAFSYPGITPDRSQFVVDVTLLQKTANKETVTVSYLGRSEEGRSGASNGPFVDFSGSAPSLLSFFQQPPDDTPSEDVIIEARNISTNNAVKWIAAGHSLLK